MFDKLNFEFYLDVSADGRGVRLEFAEQHFRSFYAAGLVLEMDRGQLWTDDGGKPRVTRSDYGYVVADLSACLFEIFVYAERDIVGRAEYTVGIGTRLEQFGGREIAGFGGERAL